MYSALPWWLTSDSAHTHTGACGFRLVRARPHLKHHFVWQVSQVTAGQPPSTVHTTPQPGHLRAPNLLNSSAALNWSKLPLLSTKVSYRSVFFAAALSMSAQATVLDMPVHGVLQAGQ